MGCLDPTEVTVSITTDARCNEVSGTALSVGRIGHTERTRADATTTRCEGEGDLGTMVLVPGADEDAPFAVKVVTSLGGDVTKCLPPVYGPTCVVARRSLSFVSGEPLELPIVMSAACAGVRCPENQTCIDGVCADASCPDPTKCKANVGPWAGTLGGTGVDVLYDLAVDGGDGVYYVGTYQGRGDLGTGALKEAQAADAFVGSLSPDGKPRWGLSLGGEGYDEALAIAVGPDGALHVTVTFSGTVDFGATALTAAGANDVALVTLSAAGQVRAARAFGGGGAVASADVAVGAGGDRWVAGGFDGDLDAGGTPATSAGGLDVFVARVAPDGELRWSRAFGGAGNDSAAAVAVDGAGNAYVTGVFDGELDLGLDGPLSAGKSGDAFVASFDPDGAPRWVRRLGGDGHDVAVDVAATADGHVAITGNVVGADELFGAALGAHTSGGFVALLDTSGELVWYDLVGDGSEDVGRRVAAAPDGSFLVAGNVGDIAVLGGTATAGVQNPFLVRYDAAGKRVSARTFGAGQWGSAAGLAASGTGDAVLGGWFFPTLELEGGPLSTRGADDVFLTRVTP